MKFDFNAAIFDMDGTLLDTMAFWRFSSIEYIIKHEYPLKTDRFSEMYTRPSSYFLRDYAQEFGIPFDIKKAFSELEGYMLRHYNEGVRTKPNASAFLEVLRKKNIPMFIATSTCKEYASIALERSGIGKYFEFITDHSETEYTKSSPVYFFNLAKRIGVSPEKCIMFEDSLYAMKSAKAAGMYVCAIEDGSQESDKEEIIKIADLYIRDYSELFDDV